VLVSSRRFHHILKAAAGLFFVANPAAALAVTSPPVMSPAPGSTPTPSNMPMSAHDMSGMTFNTNGVMSMYGMSRAGMSIDASGMDPSMMPSTTDVGTPMTREGSGTSWMPDATTLYGRMWRRGDDMTMTHGALWLRYADVGSLRGEQKLSLPSWWMFMRTHPTSPAAQAGFRAMFSGDFLGVGGSGYPLVFQTGEEWNDRPLHDVQHPHDLVSELSFTYSGQLGKRRSAYLYVGYPGEPALGPPSFMHRPIAYDYAPAPIGHHWEDATHITFGVVTAGITSTKFKAEGSAFTGREPNQTRTNFDPIRLDSYSERLSWNPNPSIAAQVSTGFVKSPESANPGIDISRMTASLLYTRPLAFDASWSHALVFGQNHENDGQRTNAYLFESDFRRNGNAFFGRAEVVQKTGNDLVISPINANSVFLIGAYTLGLAHDLPHKAGTAIGADVTLNTKPASLMPSYGSGSPLSFEVFFRLRPFALIGQSAP
jgi:hypothetical protein